MTLAPSIRCYSRSKVSGVQNHLRIGWAIRLAAIIFSLQTLSARDLALRGNPDAQSGFSVVLSTSADPISALQFDLEYESAQVALFPSPGIATRTSDKTLAVADVGDTRKRFIVYGLSSSDLSGGSLVDVATSARTLGGSLAVRLVDARAVFGNGNSAPIDIQAAPLSIVADPPPLTVSGVWNAASGQQSPVSGGGIVTLRAPGIGPSADTIPASGPVASSLGGIQVTFDGIVAALLYAGPDQINVIAPWAIADRASTRIQVTRNSQPIASVSAGVVDTTPGIFTLSAAGTGAGAILNQDNSLNSPFNPAARGSVISIYGTGLGPLSPVGVDGAIAGLAYARSAVSVTIGGVSAEVLYAGSAPSLVSGVFQINCRVPDGAATGSSVEIQVKTPGAQSVQGVTLAIE